MLAQEQEVKPEFLKSLNVRFLHVLGLFLVLFVFILSTRGRAGPSLRW